jgi:RNA polymerase sigma factor (sigma-70 family)
MSIALTMNENNKITLSETVKQYSRQLFSFIKGKTKTAEDAEDILQEVWYQLSRIVNLEELENVSAWLYSVSRNKIIDLYRKKKTNNIRRKPES